jgi:ABC-2 type transport system permease protein
MDVAALMAGTPSEVLVYYDASQQATARVIVSSISEILSEVERRMTGAPKLIETKPLTIQVEQFRNIDYLLPGILSMALMQLGLFGTFGFVELREKKIIRRLGATPLRRSMMLWAEVLIRLVIALVQCVVIVAVGTLFFHVHVVGNWLHILGTVILGASTFISLGYFLVSFARTNESAQGLIQMVQFPMMYMSGIFFPVEHMPGFLRPIMSAIPLTYLGDALRHFMLQLPTEFGITRDLSILSVWLFVSLFFAIKRFRWE